MKRTLIALVIAAAADMGAAQCVTAWSEVGAAESTTNSESTFSAMAFDEARGRLVLFDYNRTVEWVGGQWFPLVSNFPVPRRGAQLSYSAQDQKCWLFGGAIAFSSAPISASLWVWDANGWTLRSSSGPRRANHGQAFDGILNRLVVFGGSTDTDFYKLDRSTWEYAQGQWRMLGENGPSARQFPLMVFDSQRDVVVLHGGAGFNGVGGAVTYSDTWELSGGQWVLKQQTAPFPPRSGSAMVFNQDRGRTWLIGGKSGGVPFGDVWEWDGTAWVLLPTSGLAPRAFHMAAYSEATGEVFVYGGSPDGLVYPKRVSRIATVTSPRIARSPVGATRCLGSPIDDISVDATGIGLTYQWRKDGASLNGQTASALNIPQCAMTDAGIYDCVVSNSCGSATSNPATVRVLPDIRPNGQIDTADLTLFLAFFGFTTPSIADFNGDGLVNTVDLIRFLGAFGQTCN